MIAHVTSGGNGRCWLRRTMFGAGFLIAATMAAGQGTKLYVIGKSATYAQDSSGQPVMNPPEAYPWEAFVGVFGFEEGDFTAVSLTLPGGMVVPLQFTPGGDGWSLGEDLSYMTQAELNAEVPDSPTAYAYTFTPPAGSPIVAPLVLNGGNYPNAPHVSNWTAAQSIDPAQPFVLTWDPFIGGTANDVIIVQVEARFGGTIFETPVPGVEGALSGTATSVTIPAGTLAAGRTYDASISFFRAADRQTAQLTGATGYALYATATDFSVRGAGTAVGPFSTRLRFSFEHAPGVLSGGTAQFTFPVATSYQLIFEAYDDAAPPTAVTFTGPAGSQFEAAAPSDGFYDIGPNSVAFFSPRRTTGPPPAPQPPGGTYSVAYGGTVYDEAQPDPDAAARQRVVVPNLTVAGGNLTSIGWSYRTSDGSAAALPPSVLHFSVAVRSSGTARYFEPSLTDTSVAVTPAIPLSTVEGIDFSFEDDLGNRYRSSVDSAPPSPPFITTHPTSHSVRPGSSVVFLVAADGPGTLTYQWRRNGADLPGETSASLLRSNVSLADAGTYTVVVSNGNPVVSNGAVLTVSAGVISKLSNLSNRGNVGVGNDIMIPGFAIAGTGTKRLLLRAIGPTLAGFGVEGTLADPVLRLFRGDTEQSSNDNWGQAANVAEIVQVSQQVGAFGLTAGSADAVILVELAPGAYTVQASGAASGIGVGLVEVYDSDLVDEPTAILTNLSNRGFVGTGDGIMIPGVVVGGTGAQTLLLRAVGPTLANFGLGGTLANPVVRLFLGENKIAENDDWWDQPGGAQVSQVAAQVGAFPLPAGSRDAVLLVTLNPGTYTVQASGAGGTTGLALVEVYRVP